MLPLALRLLRSNLDRMEQAELSLYDDDFYAWTQQQAAILRAMPPASNRLDSRLIAEEIEDLGRSEVRSAQSLCQHIIEHLLKLEYSGLTEPAEHRRRDIIEWRLQLDKTLTRSITASSTCRSAIATPFGSCAGKSSRYRKR